MTVDYAINKPFIKREKKVVKYTVFYLQVQ